MKWKPKKLERPVTLFPWNAVPRKPVSVVWKLMLILKLTTTVSSTFHSLFKLVSVIDFLIPIHVYVSSWHHDHYHKFTMCNTHFYFPEWHQQLCIHFVAFFFIVVSTSTFVSSTDSLKCSSGHDRWNWVFFCCSRVYSTLTFSPSLISSIALGVSLKIQAFPEIHRSNWIGPWSRWKKQTRT